MKPPWIIAHRGASGHVPENTIAAFERAVQLGAGFIETDLRLTRDGQFVAIHDESLERTTNGRGMVHDFTLAELQDLDAGRWFDRQFAGEHIPSLDDVLAFARNYDTVFYLEIKYDAAWGMHHALVAALKTQENAARFIVISFDPPTLRAIRALDSSIMMGLLVEEFRPDMIEATLGVGARQLCLRTDLITKELVEQAHKSDLQVVAWTANNLGAMRGALAARVDGIMTDLPDRLRALIEDPGIEEM